MIQQIKKRDGRIVDFNPEKITAAIFKAAQSVGGEDHLMAEQLAQRVIKEFDATEQGIPSVEQIQDAIEKVLIEESHAKTAKSFILYREKRKELREAKSLMGIVDDCKLSLNALTVLEGRYLRKDDEGKAIETPMQLFERVAGNIALADGRYGKDIEKSKKEFLEMMLTRDFMPNSPTLMNAGTEIQQLSACFVLPVEDSMEGIFESVKHAAIIHKCLAGDTHIFTNPSIKELSTVSAGDKVATDHEYEKVAGSHALGKKKAIKVVTNYGYELVGSVEHKLRSIDENGNYTWKNIGKLKKGDWLAIQKLNRNLGNDALPHFKFEPKEYNQTSFQARIYQLPTTLTPELAYFFGAFIGDGSFNKSDSGRIRITIGKGKEELAQRLSNTVTTHFGIIPKLKSYGNVYDWSIQSVQIKEWLGFLGVNKNNARFVRIPNFIFKASNKCVSAFLRGYFDTDGCINNRGYISLTTSSKLMVKDLQNIFLLFGIPTIKRRLQKVNSWQITVTTNTGMKNFQKHIGFSIPEKERRLAAVDMDKIFLRKEYLPNQQKILSNYLKNELRRKYGRIINGERQLNTHQANFLLEQMSIPEIKEMLSRNQFYVQVKELSSVGEIELYDLTIPSGHCYLANGFVSHNSGGGTGFSFSRLRPKGARVGSTGGVASGPISFMRVFDAATNVIKQGGKRRGANMGVLRVDHPDILDFITCKERNDQITNFNISVGITEKFMQAVAKNENYDLVEPHAHKVVGQLHAKRVFDLICTMAWKNGEPGVIFLDRMNWPASNPTSFLGEIESTNPCITGDTIISTEYGLMRMKNLVEKYSTGGIRIAVDDRVPMPIDNGDGTLILMQSKQKGISFNEISKAFSMGVKETYKIETESGYELSCTSDHKVLTNDGWVKVTDLDSSKHKIFIQSEEGRFNSNYNLPFEVKNRFLGNNGKTTKLNLPDRWSKELGQTLGWLIGDGWLRDQDKNCRVGFTFSKQDREVMHHLKPIINYWYASDIKEVERENGVYHLSYHSKFFVDFFKALGIRAVDGNEKTVPESIFTAPKEAVVGFLQGLFSADGTIGINESNCGYYIRLTSTSILLLKEVQLLLLNLGIKSRIYNRSRSPRNLFPYENKAGEIKNYQSNGVYYELNISRDCIPKFVEAIGFILNKHQDKITRLESKSFYKTIFEESIQSIQPNGKEEVYDLTEPISLSFISNGFISLDCGEQPLLPYESCNLGSINLANHTTPDNQVDWEKLRHTTWKGVHFLDNVIDMNRFPIPKITEMVIGNRKIGLGVMGWADMLIKLRIPYNSEEAIHLGEKLMCFINCEAKKTSYSLALERGAFPNFRGSVYDDGRSESLLRNATVTTIAPTGTISIIGGCSSGIEPLFAISFLRKTPQFELLEVNPLFEEAARKEGFYTPELMMKIARRGSIRDLEEVPEHIRKVFITAMDLNADDHVKMQAAFQRHTDNAVSKTVNFPFTATVEEVTNVFLLAHHLGCKGITIYRDGSRDVQVLNVKREEHKEGLGNTTSSPISPTSAATTMTPPQPEILKVGAEFSGGCAKCNI